MNRIATVMISGGYETECCQVYSICRRNTFARELKKLGFEKIHNSSDVEKMDSDSLEDEITKWLRATKSCSQILFIGERRLVEAAFSDHPMISGSLFNNLARAVVIQLLDFADVVAQTKRSPEELFKFLEMYETVRGLIPAIRDGCSDESDHEITSEILAAGDRIGEASVKIFSDFDTSIKNDVARNQVPGGAVHPLTRYVMNYLINACDFKPALEQMFRKHAGDGGEISPFSAQLRNTMELLDANLEAKSNLYKDNSLRLIFHMNNGRYILQKIKGSPEIREAIGDAVYRRRSTDVRQFHKNYQRETWGKVLQILKHDGLVQNGGKVNKEALKERFKNFSNTMEEIHKTQSSWVVNDEQLQSELRVSISGVIIPAYRSFLGKFKHHLDGSKHVDRTTETQEITAMVRSSYAPFGNFFHHGYPPPANSYPIHDVQHKPMEVAPKHPIHEVQQRPKVVQIPVRFVGSEPSESTRSASALKIQKVLRGFLVRRSMNRIISVRREVEEIDRVVSQRETVELLRKDERERIRLNEMLMSLLFKLDSVRGIYSGIRDCRKSVTRKAIALQERIDAIVSSNPRTLTDGADEDGDGNNEEAVMVCDSPDSQISESIDRTTRTSDSSENELQTDQSDNSAQFHVADQSGDIPVEENSPVNEEKPDFENDESNEGQLAGGFVPESTSPGTHEEGVQLDATETGKGRDEDKKSREILERIMEENGKMMSLMTQLSERNETQMLMLDALTQRVEHLEKAFMCDKMRRKKMKKKHSPL
ncbi:unnamed protein product [Cuscuta campestris]|uniref:Exocyst subunit Exo70 family protein n=1 Tax=Cuscuta campestris TaxID=132261 RepID=A0A484LWY8_9ASTE|nr:unnamed protein product [Cuscuta campestris]